MIGSKPSPCTRRRVLKRLAEFGLLGLAEACGWRGTRCLAPAALPLGELRVPAVASEAGNL